MLHLETVTQAISVQSVFKSKLLPRKMKNTKKLARLRLIPDGVLVLPVIIVLQALLIHSNAQLELTTPTTTWTILVTASLVMPDITEKTLE